MAGAGGGWDIVANFVSWLLAHAFPSKETLDFNASVREWSDDEPHDLSNALISFRPMTRDDFPDVLRWRTTPHVTAWFRSAPRDLEMVEEKFGPRIDGSQRVQVDVLLVNLKPVGYMQHQMRDDGERKIAEIDFLIGEYRYINRGVGSRAIAEYSARIARLNPGVSQIISQPNIRNGRSAGALAKAGFKRVVDVAADTVNQVVYVLDLQH